ncbi:hypothetical protein [Serratia marcescens]|uniref:hypothetical protein n=1 Tax=Serratia marcescens TaxID=615 RepID=UPI00146D7B86|nr:hypothetical protein [Serratia marcescens]NMT27082.1 hypothetical protein [Serratia marcescens]
MAEQKKDQAPSVSVDALKSAFKEGATPNEKDYGALIDLAAVGSKALGAKDATPTTLEPGAGLKMDKDKLTVSAGNGVTVNDQGVAVKGDGKSVTVTDKGVGVQVKPDGGLTTDGDKGLHVKLGAGMISTTEGGLAINLADKSGLKAETSGLAVNVAAGLEFDKQGALTVKVRTGGDNYITSDKDGLAITKEGVTAIEKALKNVSLGALQKADDATKKGFKVDTTPAEPKEGVQKQIAEKLNEAFTEGWHLTQPRAALFTALKAFRTANIGKIFKEGLIAPSAVTGKTGLYNQAGEVYVAGTVIAFKVNSAGEAQEVKPGVYTADGIYALVGRLGEAGSPTTSEKYDWVTPHALMVLVAQKVVTVVGHWDFVVDDKEWTGLTSAGGWTTAPAADGVALMEKQKSVAEAEWKGQLGAMRTPQANIYGIDSSLSIEAYGTEGFKLVMRVPKPIVLDGYSGHGTNKGQYEIKVRLHAFGQQPGLKVGLEPYTVSTGGTVPGFFRVGGGKDCAMVAKAICSYVASGEFYRDDYLKIDVELSNDLYVEGEQLTIRHPADFWTQLSLAGRDVWLHIILM